jgi:hypothetical protein
MNRTLPMRKSQLMTALLTVSALSITALTSTGFAKQLDTQDSAGKLETPTVSFRTDGFGSTNKESEQTLDVFVPSWSLGVIGVDIDGANLEIAGVDAPEFLTVELKDASGGATTDRLQLVVKADANTPKGEYPIEVTLENKKFGESGTVIVMAKVE